jgi:hypothetical protein
MENPPAGLGAKAEFFWMKTLPLLPALQVWSLPDTSPITVLSSKSVKQQISIFK